EPDGEGRAPLLGADRGDAGGVARRRAGRGVRGGGRRGEGALRRRRAGLRRLARRLDPVEHGVGRRPGAALGLRTVRPRRPGRRRPRTLPVAVGPPRRRAGRGRGAPGPSRLGRRTERRGRPRRRCRERPRGRGRRLPARAGPPVGADRAAAGGRTAAGAHRLAAHAAAKRGEPAMTTRGRPAMTRYPGGEHPARGPSDATPSGTSARPDDLPPIVPATRTPPTTPEGERVEEPLDLDRYTRLVRRHIRPALVVGLLGLLGGVLLNVLTPGMYRATTH